MECDSHPCPGPPLRKAGGVRCGLTEDPGIDGANGANLPTEHRWQVRSQMSAMAGRKVEETVGGGTKKVLYTLQTVRRIGLKNSARALKARNTCKACGLGMGGQQGGMTNEAGEFPSVCNKSIQAQSTDIQPPIPSAVFDHPLRELRELTAREL